MALLRVSDALAAGREREAAALVFEYMAATQAETGRPVPDSPDGLPPVLARECRDLAAAYPPPGVLLTARLGRYPAGCTGLAARLPPGTGEIKRLYVRPACRGRGIAVALMSRLHQHAAEHGFTRLVLDVLPERTGVIEFYRRLGYRVTGQGEADSPVPMIFLDRVVTPL
jgi:ribosomal protein S18 acetylase RimI-like enzyme